MVLNLRTLPLSTFTGFLLWVFIIVVPLISFAQKPVNSSSKEAIKLNMQKYHAALEEENHEQSIIHLKNVLDLKVIDSVNYPSLLSNLAGHYFDLKKYSKAMEYYNFAISLNPEEPLFYEFRGDLKRELKDYRGALVDYEQSLSMSQVLRWEVFDSKGLAYKELNKFDLAIQSYSKAIEILKYNYQDNSIMAEFFYDVIIFERGVCFLAVGEKERGCLDLSKAGELGISEAYQLISKYCN